jgi:lysozyme
MRKPFFDAWRPLLGGLTASQVAAIDRLLDQFKIPKDKPVNRQTTSLGRSLIAQREGLSLKAYRDAVGIWTIGVGHTPAYQGQTISHTQADELLAADLARFEACVNDAVKVPITTDAFDALVSLAFNIGETAFRRSTLLRKLNAGDQAGAANQFLVWHRAGNKPFILSPRRRAERLQFLSERHEPRA